MKLEFLRTDAQYRENIRCQKALAKYIAWKVRLEFPLDKIERGFLAAQRNYPIPNIGRGRPRDYSHLDDAEYALLRTSRLSEVAPNLNPGKKKKRNGADGRKRKHDYANMALAVQVLIKFRGFSKTAAFQEVANAYGVKKSQIIYAWNDAGEAAQMHLADVD